MESTHVKLNPQPILHLIKDVAQATLLPRFSHLDHRRKSDGSFLTEADGLMQQQIERQLLQLYPDIPLLGEEMGPEQQRQLLDSAPRLWCLDPLDGTTNFASGFPCFSVSLALLIDGKPHFGVVYDPIRDECFYALERGGAFLNQQRLLLPEIAPSIEDAVALVDFKRLPEPLILPLIQHPPYTSQRSIGSVALDWCWLAANRAQLYLHSRQGLWDFAAGELIFREAGGVYQRFDGAPLNFQQLERQQVIAALSPDLLQVWSEWLQLNP